MFLRYRFKIKKNKKNIQLSWKNEKKKMMKIVNFDFSNEILYTTRRSHSMVIKIEIRSYELDQIRVN